MLRMFMQGYLMVFGLALVALVLLCTLLYGTIRRLLRTGARWDYIAAERNVGRLVGPLQQPHPQV